MQHFLLLLFILVANNIHSQNTPLVELFSKLKENKVYALGKIYTYDALKLNAEGDTISTETIRMNIASALNQEAEEETINFVWEHDPSPEDSIRLSPISKAVCNRPWIRRDTTTLSLNDEYLYIHPLRENQFYQAEVAAHPMVRIDDKVAGQFKSKTVIMKGFGSYNMHECASIYTMSDKESIYRYNGSDDMSCYTILTETSMKKFSFGSASQETNEGFKANSTATFLVHEEYGFVSLVYNFYDGTSLRLSMVL